MILLHVDSDSPPVGLLEITKVVSQPLSSEVIKTSQRTQLRRGNLERVEKDYPSDALGTFCYKVSSRLGEDSVKEVTWSGQGTNVRGVFLRHFSVRRNTEEVSNLPCILE